ncbi:MAG TPA: hypothetical protein VGC26_01105 [Afipia sp.]
MADEAFALSPISARSTSPTDDDYDAIREAFLETARGRWFLGEYAKRNRNADTAMVLDAVARIEKSLAASSAETAAMMPAADGVVDAPPTLASDEILASVKVILERTRNALVAALSVPDMEQSLSSFQRSARIIQEIAWGLRESGSDGRICNILDAQVRAMTTACDALAAVEHRDIVLHSFDASMVQIEKLAGPMSPADEPTISMNEAPANVPLQGGVHMVAVSPETNIPEMDVAVIEAVHAITMEAAAPSVIVEADNMAAPSLGDSLITRGIIASTPATADPLAPIRRMSQAEKIAFFS